MLKILRRVAFASCVVFSLSLLISLTAFAQGGTGRETAGPSSKKATAKKKPSRRRSRLPVDDEESDDRSRTVNPRPVSIARPTPAPGDFEYNEGLKKYFTSSYAEAINYFKEALRLNPNSPSTYQYLGDCYYFTNRYEEAATIYEQFIKLSGDEQTLTTYSTRDVFTRLAYSYRKLQRDSSAEDIERRQRSICAVHKCWK